MRQLESVSLRDRIAIMDDGSMCPITNMLDEFGDECEPDECVCIIVHESQDRWIVYELDQMEFVTAH